MHMDKEELIKFLKDNMRVGVYTNTVANYDSVDTHVGVTIYIGDEEI